LCAFCAFIGNAHAKKWHLMLIPNAHLSTDANQQSSASPALTVDYSSLIRETMSNELSKELYVVIVPERVFPNCDSSLCGMESVQSALVNVVKLAPEVELVLFYHFDTTSSPFSLRASLIDPISFQTYDTFGVNVLAQNRQDISDGQIRSLARDIGKVISQRLQQTAKRNEFDLVLKGFALGEVAPFSTFALSETQDTRLTLTRSEKEAGRWSEFLPTMETQFTVSSSLTQSQFNQLLVRFFLTEDIDVINEYQRDTNAFVVNRLGNPYTPSLISSVLLVLVALVLMFIFIKRQMYHFQLQTLAEKKAVNQWLSVHSRAKSPWYFLHDKWGNQYSYWQRLERESSELENQAMLFFDAGDVITAKLFISKALNINTDASGAKALMKKIAEQESSEKELSEKEQWVRNKVAKAMNNYRGNQAIKALRQAYQAADASAGEKKLKRQHKAIKRLIHKIIADFSQAHENIELTDLLTGDTCLVSAANELDIGRAASAQGQEDFTGKGNNVEFTINHKALSRLGKQCKVSADENGFYIQDQGSTNGSFLQSSVLGKERRSLKHGDVIYLGANSELTAVKLSVEIDSGHSMLKLRVQKQLQHTLEVGDLARAWPDYVNAMRSSAVLTRSDCVLAVDSDTDALRLVSKAELSDNAQLRALAQFTLGQYASLMPLIGLKDEPGDRVFCNKEPLYGQVPLLLPCELKWRHQHILIDAYTLSGLSRIKGELKRFKQDSQLHDASSSSLS
jgi:hypothetical protein